MTTPFTVDFSTNDTYKIQEKFGFPLKVAPGTHTVKIKAPKGKIRVTVLVVGDSIWQGYHAFEREFDEAIDGEVGIRVGLMLDHEQPSNMVTWGV